MSKFRVEGVLWGAERFFPEEESLVAAARLLGGGKPHTYEGRKGISLEVEDSTAGDQGGLFDQLCALMSADAEELYLRFTDLFNYDRGWVILSSSGWRLEWADEEDEW